MPGSIELPGEIMSRIEVEAGRCQLSVAHVIARLVARLPVREGGNGRDAPAFIGAGASSTGITHRVDELLADGFGRS